MEIGNAVTKLSKLIISTKARMPTMDVSERGATCLVMVSSLYILLKSYPISALYLRKFEDSVIPTLHKIDTPRAINEFFKEVLQLGRDVRDLIANRV